MQNLFLLLSWFFSLGGLAGLTTSSTYSSLPVIEMQVENRPQIEPTPSPWQLAGPPAGPQPEAPGQVHGLYFYGNDCEHCQAVYEEVIRPLQSELGDRLDLRMIEISAPENYELLIRAEEYFHVKAGERGLPTTVLGDQVLIGEVQSRERLAGLARSSAAGGGLDWPSIPDFDPARLGASGPTFGEIVICEVDNPEACATSAPVYAAYFYQVGCQSCSRAEADIRYLKTRFPQLIVEKFNIYEQAALADWLAQRAGRPDFAAPAVFIGERAFIGEGEITPAALEAAIEFYSPDGAPKTWENFDALQVEGGLVERFRAMGWLAVVFAGLVDGLNPCAFATLIFFVSYLTLSGRRGREVVMVGGAFTIGVFLAYLLVGLGFYKILDLVGSWLTVVGRWVYGLTALLCLALAGFSFLDFLKARRGEIGDMSLNLPHALRMRINAAIREGSKAHAYLAGAFLTGITISFLELACTGQIYLPTIIFVSSIPDLRLQAFFYLLLYNLLFILPLIVVFVLAYYGTTSNDLTRFLQRNAALVKLGMMVLFLSLAVWLTVSIIA